MQLDVGINFRGWSDDKAKILEINMKFLKMM